MTWRNRDGVLRWKSFLLRLNPSSPNLQLEKENLQTGLEEAEATLEQEENKVLRAQLELSLLRKEIDKRIEEKQEEFNNTR